MKNTITLLLLLVMASGPVTAQVAIYQSNPFGLLTKERVKLEARINSKNSMLAAFTRHYDGLSPGYQVYGEYRNYRFIDSLIELFIYGKAGYGECEYSHGPYSSLRPGSAEYLPFTYQLAGAGVGLHVYLHKSKFFFIDVAAGVKVCNVTRSVTPLFYVTGPGSLIDLHFNFGLQLGNKKLHDNPHRHRQKDAEYQQR